MPGGAWGEALLLVVLSVMVCTLIVILLFFVLAAGIWRGPAAGRGAFPTLCCSVCARRLLILLASAVALCLCSRT